MGEKNDRKIEINTDRKRERERQRNKPTYKFLASHRHLIGISIVYITSFPMKFPLKQINLIAATTFIDTNVPYKTNFFSSNALHKQQLIARIVQTANENAVGFSGLKRGPKQEERHKTQPHDNDRTNKTNNTTHNTIDIICARMCIIWINKIKPNHKHKL